MKLWYYYGHVREKIDRVEEAFDLELMREEAFGGDSSERLDYDESTLEYFEPWATDSWEMYDDYPDYSWAEYRASKELDEELEKPMSKVPTGECRHPNLHFGSGDYYIFCHDCGRWWCTIDPTTHDVRPDLANLGVGSQLSGQVRTGE